MWILLQRKGPVNCAVFFLHGLQNELDVLDYGTLFVLTCHILTDMGRVIKGKII